MGAAPPSVPDRTYYPSLVPVNMQTTGVTNWKADYRACFTNWDGKPAYTPPNVQAQLTNFVIKDNIGSGTLQMENRTFSLTVTMVAYGAKFY